MNTIKTNLLNYALDRGIGVYFLALDPNMQPIANVEHRMIVINSKWPNKKEIPLQIAHEISHILNGDDYIHTMHVEGNANKKALELLVPEYFKEIDIEDVNINRFMNDLCLPSYMYDAAEKQIKEFYKTKI